MMQRDLINSALAIVVFTVVFGLVYPLVMTGVAQVLFGEQGRRLEGRGDGEVVGSSLIAQAFSARPSAARASSATRPTSSRARR